MSTRPRLLQWGGAPQWTTHQVAWWVCVLGSGWTGPSAMALFLGVHLWVTRAELKRELRAVGMAVGLGFAADTLLALTGAVTFEGSLRVGVVPLWMIALWAGFGATLLHSQRRLVTGRLFAAGLGAIVGPLAYLGGEGLGRLSVAEGYGLILIGLAWAVVLGALSTEVSRHEAEIRRGAG